MLRRIILNSSLSILLTLSGCAAAGAIIGKTIPEPPVPAEYVLYQTPVIVIAESKSSDTLTQLDGDRLGRLVTNEIYDYQLAPTIETDQLVELRDRLLSKYKTESIQSIGRQIGAEQVVYIEIMNVGVGTSAGSDIVKCVASATVKVIDVASGKLVYPEDSASGRLVNFQTRPERLTPDMTPASLRGEALDGLAHNIVKLFRDWRAFDEPSELGVE